MRDVWFVVLPEVVLLDVAGAADAFRMANQQRRDSYRLNFAGPAARVRAAVGLQIDSLQPLPARIADDAIIVIAGVASSALRLDSAGVTAVARWLSRVLDGSGATLMCVCAGSLVAAKAGVLRDRECTTHHEFTQLLARIEPSATVHGDRIFVEHDNVLTSAGVTSGIDLTLHVIGQQLGHQVAAAVARDLVVYMRRSGGDPQLSPWVMHRNHVHPVVHRVQDAVSREPAREWSSESLAGIACTSSRHLARLFAEHAGCSPLDYVQRIRVALARELVINSRLALERVAERSGFSSAHQMRRVWRRWDPVPPASYRVGAG